MRHEDLIYAPSTEERRTKRLQAWETLIEAVRECRRCPLCNSRTQSVFGDGPIDTDLMFIGEAPGADEDAQGKPFVGRAGQLLNRILEAAGIARESIFITNVVKCRPPNNRVPAVEETMRCDPYLQSQISLIQPKIIVCLGSTPVKWILKTTEGITNLRGRWFDWKGIKVIPMFHPSYLLRNPSSKIGSPKHLTWLDIQKVKEEWEKMRTRSPESDAGRN